MGRSWEWLGLNLGKRAGLVASAGLAVSIALGAGLSQIQFSTSNADYLNHNDPAAVGNREYSALFGGDPIAVLFTMRDGATVDDLLTPANQAEMSRVDAALSRDPDVYDVISPLTALGFSSALRKGPDIEKSVAAQMMLSAYSRDHNPASKSVRLTYLLAESQLIDKFTPSEEVLSNPRWMHFILHEPDGRLRSAVTDFIPDQHHALMAVLLRPNLSFNQELAAAARVQAITGSAHYQNATTITTGVPEIEKDVNDYIRNGLRELVVLAALLMAFILLVAFRVRWRLLPFVILGIGMVWAFGLVGYLGIPLTFATLTAIPVLMGVGMDYSIQMHARIEEEVELNRAAHPIQSAARGLGPALLIVTFDAVFAFMALWFSKVPAVRQFGSLMVIGIIAVCTCSLMLTLAVLGIREYRSPTKPKNVRDGTLSRITVRLSSLPSKAAVPAIVIAGLVFVAGVCLEGKLVIQPDPIKWLNSSSSAVKQIETLQSVTGSDNQIAIIVNTRAPFAQSTINYVTHLTDVEQQKYGSILFPGAGLISSTDDFLTIHGSDVVPPTASEIKQFYALAPPALQRQMVGSNGRSLNVTLLSRTNDFARLEPIIANLPTDAPPPPGITVEPGGIGVVSVGLLENLAGSRSLLTYLALLFVGAFLAVRLRSIVRSLLRFVEERNRGHAAREAMTITASRTGRAFLVSAMTATAGIAVIATSSMPMLRGFGIVMALNVAVALACALIVLPPILVWAEEKRGWVTRGLIKPVPAPIEFEAVLGVQSVEGTTAIVKAK
jgi:predicted RND superfamily exporter protein